ncbi:hypothetical protein LCGC14_1441720, partial [marine sediment metagenome]
MTLIRDINNILEYGRKTTSYKYATLLAIFDFITEHPSELAINNLHFIPIVYLARQFISYYYPFSFHNFYQGSLAADKSLKVLNYIDEFKVKTRSGDNTTDKIHQKIRTLKEGGVFWVNRLYELPDSLTETLIKLLWQVRQRILLQPLTFLHKVKGEIIRFFSILNSDLPFKSSYDEHREGAIKQRKPPVITWADILQYDKTALVIDDLTYQELARYRFWTRDVILKAWFNYCLEGESKRNNSTSIEILLFKLLGYIYTSDLARDPLLISHYRDLYEELGAKICVYTGNLIKSGADYHIDHLLPWSYYPINRFWNLYPSEPSINIKKSNNIPEWTDFLEENIRSHIQLCLSHKEHPLIYNDLNYYYYNLMKNRDLDILNRENKLIEKEIISFLKSERKKLLEIVPGRIFKPIENDN